MQICDKCGGRAPELYLTRDGYWCLNCCSKDPELTLCYPYLTELVRCRNQAK